MYLTEATRLEVRERGMTMSFFHGTRDSIASIACIDEEVAQGAENFLPLSDNIYLSVRVTCQVEP